MYVEERLAALGLVFPEPPMPLGNYTAVGEAGGLLFISGQVPLADGKVNYTGRIGDEITIEDGQQASQLTAVLDGASDLFTAALGHKTGHARSAFSHSQLPAKAAVVIVVTAQLISA